MFAFYGQCVDKQFSELTPGIIGQRELESMSGLGKLPKAMDCANTTDDNSMDNSGRNVLDLLKSFEEASNDKFAGATYQEQVNDESQLTLSQEKNDAEHLTVKRTY